jgi:hypothetical protein
MTGEWIIGGKRTSRHVMWDVSIGNIGLTTEKSAIRH